MDRDGRRSSYKLHDNRAVPEVVERERGRYSVDASIRLTPCVVGIDARNFCVVVYPVCARRASDGIHDMGANSTHGVGMRRCYKVCGAVHHVVPAHPVCFEHIQILALAEHIFVSLGHQPPSLSAACQMRSERSSTMATNKIV